MSYGFAPNILPSQVPNAQHIGVAPPPLPTAYGGGGAVGGSGGAYPSLGWAFSGDQSNFGSTSTFGGVSDVSAVSQTEIPCQAIFVPEDEMPIYGSYYVS